MNQLTHVDENGQLNMVDVSGKSPSVRTATASGIITMSEATISQILSHSNKKGDVLTTAKIAGIMAAKRCSELIPLCHPLQLSKVDVNLEIDRDRSQINIMAMCKLVGNTGVEMEALTAVNVAALTLFDMCKASDPAMEIGQIKVDSKSGGKSGDWLNPHNDIA